MSYYTAEQIATFAQRQGCTVEDFRFRWIIAHDKNYYVYGPAGYMAPIKGNLASSIRRDLAAVPSEKDSPAGIDWTIIDEPQPGKKTKPPRTKPIEVIIREYVTVARHHVSSMAIPYSYYDQTTHTFYERVCPLRPLIPEYDANVDQWLRHLGGRNAEKLLDWVATITDLSRATCALYIHAPKDYGKTLFAAGMAKLWSAVPTEYESIIGNFNSAILTNPLILADEYLPKGVNSGALRSLIGVHGRALKRKGIDESSVTGAVRLILTANNDKLLSRLSDDELSNDDIDAVAARFLYIIPSRETAYFLGTVDTREWVTRDKIAKHALWLRDNRVVTPGKRFLIEGSLEALKDKITTGGALREGALEWVAKAMFTDWLEQNPGIVVGNGRIYVNASFVKTHWERLTGISRIPTLQALGRAFKPLSLLEKRLPLFNRRADFYAINPELVYEHGKYIASREEFEALVRRKIDDDPGDEGGGTKDTQNGAENGVQNDVNFGVNFEAANGHQNRHQNGHQNGHKNEHHLDVNFLLRFTQFAGAADPQNDRENRGQQL